MKTIGYTIQNKKTKYSNFITVVFSSQDFEGTKRNLEKLRKDAEEGEKFRMIKITKEVLPV